MKKIVGILLILSIIFITVGCAECISTEYETVEVKVTDAHHKGVWMQPMKVGKTTTYINHPAKYKITVEYDGKEYVIDDRDTYNKYKDKLGQTTNATLEIKTYDDDSVRYNIISLE